VPYKRDARRRDASEPSADMRAVVEPFDTFYGEVIKPQAEKLYEVVRIDEKSGPGAIFQDMQREVRQSDVSIAEITLANPNVFYELGYAQALGKPAILWAQRGGKLPSDIASYRVVFYDDSIGGKSRVEEDLARHLDAINQSTE
jgi:nucleoside 2-deoxyribosyltransferase